MTVLPVLPYSALSLIGILPSIAGNGEEARGPNGQYTCISLALENREGHGPLRKTRDALNQFMPVFKDTEKTETLGNGVLIAPNTAGCQNT